MKKKHLVIVGIIILILVVILIVIVYFGKSLEYNNSSHNYGSVPEVYWINCVKVDEITYTKNDSTIIQNEINKEIGNVKFTLAGSVYDSSYTMKSWDATCLAENTKLFSVQDDENSIAALVDGIYYVYKK